MHRHYFKLFLALGLIYLAATFLLPPDPATLEKYDLTPTSLRLLSLSVQIPLLLIWFAAFYGYGKFKNYVVTIGKSKEATHFSKIADGLGVLAIGLTVTSIVTTFVRYFAQIDKVPAGAPPVVSEYLSLIVAFAGFVLISQGAKGALKHIKVKPVDSNKSLVKVIFIALAALYLFATFGSSLRLEDETTIFGNLPDWLILITIVLPYLYTWYIGLLAALNIGQYQKKTTGIIYKYSLRYISLGVAGVVGASIVLHLISGIGSVFSKLGLNSLLAVVYVIVMIYGVGYILIAKGAKRLQKIEEV